MGAPATGQRFYRVLVAVETDPTVYYGPDARRPAVLAARDAEQMLAHLAADLQALLPGIADCSLIAAGALYDQTQLMRPGFPVFAALEATAATPASGAFRAGLVSVGAAEGRLPVDALQPLTNLPLGALLLLPVVVHGPAERLSELGQSMEYRFLEEGQLSAHSAAWLASAFKVTINHARFMTLTDLSALLRMQLDHFGFLPLWELLDAALSGRAEPLAVETPGGQRLEWRDGAVHAVFETFDYWASEGAGAAVPAQRLRLAEGYGQRTRELRQYLATLGAHGVGVEFHLPGERRPLEGSFLAEASGQAAADGAPAITEHGFDNVGTVAISFAREGTVTNYYPLSPRGLNDIHASLRDRVAAGRTVAFPGTIVYDETTRRLRPDDAGDA